MLSVRSAGTAVGLGVAVAVGGWLLFGAIQAISLAVTPAQRPLLLLGLLAAFAIVLVAWIRTTAAVRRKRESNRRSLYHTYIARYVRREDLSFEKTPFAWYESFLRQARETTPDKDWEHVSSKELLRWLGPLYEDASTSLSEEAAAMLISHILYLRYRVGIQDLQDRESWKDEGVEPAGFPW